LFSLDHSRIVTSVLLATVICVSAQTRDYPKTPPDKPARAQGAQQATDIGRAIVPYIAKARKTYPAAKKRFLAGLPPKYLFSLTTKLWDRSHTKFEVVFVVADQIKNDTVAGHLATHTKQPVGYDYGDRISFPESEIMDWTIVHPEGTEEGNVVGKFLDNYHR
jgi:serine protease inhibitor ecotin